MNFKLYPIALIGALLIVSCSSSKFRASTIEDQPLYAAINELKKHPGNSKAQNDLTVFYDQAVERHEEAVSVYRASQEPSRWDKIMSELTMLQNISIAVAATPGAATILKPNNYTRELEETKTAAAEDFYSRGMSFIGREGRENSLMAYQSFLQVNRFVPGYKDVTELLNESYNKSVVNIVINPVSEANLPLSTFENWNGNDLKYRPEEYQESLARDLAARSSAENPVRVITDREAQRQNITPDMAVDLHWRSLSAVPSKPYLYNRDVTKKIKIGKDTADKPVYKTVHATLHITEMKYAVRGDLEYAVRDMISSNADQSILTDEVFWTDNYATYSGDSRALSTEDWAMINNNKRLLSIPSKGEILNALMRKMYPELRRRMEVSLGL